MIPAAHRRRSGFTLIWVSVLLTVASLVLVSLLPGREAGDVGQKSLATIDKLEKIEASMRAFMAFNGRRPCRRLLRRRRSARVFRAGGQHRWRLLQQRHNQG